MATRRRRRSPSPPTTASSPYFPPELIPEVAKRLTNLQDFFALRAGCRTYRGRPPPSDLNQPRLPSAPTLRPLEGRRIPWPLPPYPPPDPPLPLPLHARGRR
ncbi:unnamed protein product [Urochloa humidicola]